MLTGWNGDPSLLKDTDISEVRINFEDRTFKAFAVMNDGSTYEFSWYKFTLVSPFGYVARGIRRFCSNAINDTEIRMPENESERFFSLIRKAFSYPRFLSVGSINNQVEIRLDRDLYEEIKTAIGKPVGE